MKEYLVFGKSFNEVTHVRRAVSASIAETIELHAANSILALIFPPVTEEPFVFGFVITNFVAGPGVGNGCGS